MLEFSVMSGCIQRGCKRAFLVAGDRDVTAAELFAWCYARRLGRKRVRLSARDGDETFLDRRNAYRAIRTAASKIAVKVGRVWPGGNVWRLRESSCDPQSRTSAEKSPVG
jgi:hypothetical protein